MANRGFAGSEPEDVRPASKQNAFHRGSFPGLAILSQTSNITFERRTPGCLKFDPTYSGVPSLSNSVSSGKRRDWVPYAGRFFHELSFSGAATAKR